MRGQARLPQLWILSSGTSVQRRKACGGVEVWTAGVAAVTGA